MHHSVFFWNSQCVKICRLKPSVGKLAPCPNKPLDHHDFSPQSLVNTEQFSQTISAFICLAASHAVVAAEVAAFPNDFGLHLSGWLAGWRGGCLAASHACWLDGRLPGWLSGWLSS